MSLKHEVTKLSEGVWCLSEFKLVNSFLVEGEERAALIDTGCGIGNLHQAVRELTDKPLVILITHQHFDHDGGVGMFPGVPVYLNPEDGSRMESMIQMMQKIMGSSDLNVLRRNYIETRGPIRCPELPQEELLKLVPENAGSMEYEWLPLTDGMEIDLGGRTLRAIHTPGHTPGEMCILDEKSRILFSGDTSNESIILMRQPDNDTRLIRMCHETMAKLWAMEGLYDRLGVGHDKITLPKQIVKDYMDLSAGLLDGSITGQYEESGFRKGDVARLGLAELWYQCDA